METKHEGKQCMRCKTLFECKPMDISNCQCSLIQLSQPELNYLQSTYDDCLCIECLRAIQQEFHLSTKS